MQYSRDFKGHLASLFLNENINLGKKYVFDIRRTSKEVYDHARRALYNSGVVDLMSRSSDHSSPSRSPSRDNQQDEGLDCSSCQQSRALEERLQKLREALLCMLCCEEEIDAAFCPCGHMVCCQTCANQLQVRLFFFSHCETVCNFPTEDLWGFILKSQWETYTLWAGGSFLGMQTLMSALSKKKCKNVFWQWGKSFKTKETLLFICSTPQVASAYFELSVLLKAL